MYDLATCGYDEWATLSATATYYRARYYDPQIGRFMSEDPLRFNGDGTNFYGYVNNNPVIGFDPFGLRTKCTYAGVPRTLVCWDDGKGKQRPNDFVQLLFNTGKQVGIPKLIREDYEKYSQCAAGGPKISVEFGLNKPAVPANPNGFNDDYGTKLDPQMTMSVSVDCSKAIGCLDKFPLAAADPRFNMGEVEDHSSSMIEEGYHILKSLFYDTLPF